MVHLVKCTIRNREIMFFLYFGRQLFVLFVNGNSRKMVNGDLKTRFYIIMCTTCSSVHVCWFVCDEIKRSIAEQHTCTTARKLNLLQTMDLLIKRGIGKHLRWFSTSYSHSHLVLIVSCVSRSSDNLPIMFYSLFCF